jgi:hypothetical protein
LDLLVLDPKNRVTSSTVCRLTFAISASAW